MDSSLLILIGLLLLFFVSVICLLISFRPTETQRYSDLKNAVTFFSHECGDITWKVKRQSYRISLKPGKSMDGKALQKEVKKHVTHAPINTKIRITNYAWDLANVLISFDLLPEKWEPVGAYSYCNGVVMVRYMEKPPAKGPANTAFKELYFSAADGHLIYLKK